jgi:hypothetical protein
MALGRGRQRLRFAADARSRSALCRRERFSLIKTRLAQVRISMALFDEMPAVLPVCVSSTSFSGLLFMTSKPSQPKNAAAGAAVPNAPALWQQLDAVAKALHGILGGQSSKAVLAQVPQRLRPGVQALLFQVLRNLGRAQALQSSWRRAHRRPRSVPC